MNKLTGKITQIQKSGSILLVDMDVDGHGFSALLIESTNNPQWLEKDNFITLAFKETEVSLAKNLSGQLSMRNRLNCTVLKVMFGDLLSTVSLQFQNKIITAAITTRSLELLNLAEGQQVTALIKANEVSLMKINS